MSSNLTLSAPAQSTKVQNKPLWGIERLVQEPADAQIIGGGIAASGLVAHTLISRFVDHLPYYRQEAINARSGVHTPRSTLASQSGRAGAAMERCTKRISASC